MLCTKDAWVFPLEISISDWALTPASYWSFVRPSGERGEVPDWTFLVHEFPEKGYVRAREIINPDQKK